jgi:hypothetical protein
VGLLAGLLASDGPSIATEPTGKATMRHDNCDSTVPVQLCRGKVPACQCQIAHDGDAPQPKCVYRCHVCRLELTLDETTRKLILVE